MRSKRDAIVDTMGCERCADPTAPAHVQRFQTLVSLMLSSQTKDPVTFAATKRLIALNGCSAEAVCAMDEETLASTIFPVGFYRNKSRFLKAAASSIVADFGGDIPATIEGLQSLKGVGPKMAHICMLAAWGRSSGIGVDTHVHRITNRLGWASTATPEQTRVALESWMPPEYWPELNILMVGFGQQVCLPIGPKCDGCMCRSTCPVGSKVASGGAGGGSASSSSSSSGGAGTGGSSGGGGSATSASVGSKAVGKIK